ncbi:hypothetical protein G6O69_35825 [Pseudenhygromyxa sp. WMMC2535]|uniref:hypothetical protein n=1 Tax=Pseudenhygromyxa sp. WMMC2535 TaxID=2712867 RepID=UPI0015535941|nr:hypothetical protein [Pseudenhygromyxa sp. WMMC2535]NVB43249.1 hypothetical protein [Pseudenhygromyxa sp. WMMC2535]
MATSSRACHLSLLAALACGCGRTDPQWWADIYASEDDTGEQGETLGTETSAESSDTASSESESSESESSESESESSDTASSDTASSESESSESESDTGGCLDPQPFSIAPTPASVVLLVDQGAHMDQDFDGLSRWEAITEAVFEPDSGVAWTWESALRLGLSTYTSFNGDNGGTCPVLAEQPPDLDNAAAMEALWLTQVAEDENPTGDAIAALAAALGGSGRRHLVLLSARDPDTCATPNPQSGADAAVLAAQAAFAQGIALRVVDLGDGDLDAGFAQSLANAGLGLEPDGPIDAPLWAPADTAALRDELDALLGSLHSCEFELSHSLVDGGEQLCTFTLDDQPLVLADPNGWTVSDSAHVELLGAACSALDQGAVPAMSCACEAY